MPGLAVCVSYLEFIFKELYVEKRRFQKFLILV